MEKDPWLCNSANCEVDLNSKREFEDNFVEKSQKLPDSEEYLAALERKLNKLKKTGGYTRSDEKNLLNSLENSRESCMCRLISGDISTGTNNDIDLDAPVDINSTTGWLKSQVNPEQPLTVGELVELVKADYLANQNSEQSNEEKPS